MYVNVQQNNRKRTERRRLTCYSLQNTTRCKANRGSDSLRNGARQSKREVTVSTLQRISITALTAVALGSNQRLCGRGRSMNLRASGSRRCKCRSSDTTVFKSSAPTQHFRWPECQLLRIRSRLLALEPGNRSPTNCNQTHPAIGTRTINDRITIMYEHSDYLREKAAKYLELAKKEEDSFAKKELLQLAGICEEVANDMDDRRVSG